MITQVYIQSYILTTFQHSSQYSVYLISNKLVFHFYQTTQQQYTALNRIFSYFIQIFERITESGLPELSNHFFRVYHLVETRLNVFIQCSIHVLNPLLELVRKHMIFHHCHSLFWGFTVVYFHLLHFEVAKLANHNEFIDVIIPQIYLKKFSSSLST